jgi:hypothetical protein
MKNVALKLLKIQQELKVNKSQFNKFGNYHYRSCEDILEALKPILAKHNTTIFINDTIENLGDRFYVKATAILFDIESGEAIETTAYAREEETKKGMDGSQITGSASSYSRKYALNGLFCIDDTKDSDSTNRHGKEEQKDDKLFDTPQTNNDCISESQAKRIFAISKGNTQLVKEILMKYNYTSSKDVKKSDYNSICEDIVSKV